MILIYALGQALSFQALLKFRRFMHHFVTFLAGVGLIVLFLFAIRIAFMAGRIAGRRGK